MPNQTVQLVLLVGAYVIVCVGLIGNGLFLLFNYRSLSRIEGRKDLTTRVTRAENELASFRELFDTFSKRLNRREGAQGSNRTRSANSVANGSGSGIEADPLASLFER